MIFAMTKVPFTTVLNAQAILWFSAFFCRVILRLALCYFPMQVLLATTSCICYSIPCPPDVWRMKPFNHAALEESWIKSSPVKNLASESKRKDSKRKKKQKRRNLETSVEKTRWLIDSLMTQSSTRTPTKRSRQGPDLQHLHLQKWR